jgi:hypothetical protein
MRYVFGFIALLTKKAEKMGAAFLPVLPTALLRNSKCGDSHGR